MKINILIFLSIILCSCIDKDLSLREQVVAKIVSATFGEDDEWNIYATYEVTNFSNKTICVFNYPSARKIFTENTNVLRSEFTYMHQIAKDASDLGASSPEGPVQEQGTYTPHNETDAKALYREIKPYHNAKIIIDSIFSGGEFPLLLDGQEDNIARNYIEKVQLEVEYSPCDLDNQEYPVLYYNQTVNRDFLPDQWGIAVSDFYHMK